jgi:Uncharacterized protein conserved in archaea
MLNDFEAVFENGVLRPLESLPLAEREHVRVTVSRATSDEWLDLEFMDAAAVSGDPAVTLEQVRIALAKIRGRMDDAIDQQRGEF